MSVAACLSRRSDLESARPSFQASRPNEPPTYHFRTEESSQFRICVQILGVDGKQVPQRHKLPSFTCSSSNLGSSFLCAPSSSFPSALNTAVLWRVSHFIFNSARARSTSSIPAKGSRFSPLFFLPPFGCEGVLRPLSSMSIADTTEAFFFFDFFFFD